MSELRRPNSIQLMFDPPSNHSLAGDQELFIQEHPASEDEKIPSISDLLIKITNNGHEKCEKPLILEFGKP